MWSAEEVSFKFPNQIIISWSKWYNLSINKNNCKWLKQHINNFVVREKKKTQQLEKDAMEPPQYFENS